MGNYDINGPAEPKVGVWRQITVPGTTNEINKVWWDHLARMGRDELEIRDGCLWARRHP